MDDPQNAVRGGHQDETDKAEQQKGTVDLRDGSIHHHLDQQGLTQRDEGGLGDHHNDERNPPPVRAEQAQHATQPHRRFRQLSPVARVNAACATLTHLLTS